MTKMEGSGVYAGLSGCVEKKTYKVVQVGNSVMSFIAKIICIHRTQCFRGLPRFSDVAYVNFRMLSLLCLGGSCCNCDYTPRMSCEPSGMFWTLPQSSAGFKFMITCASLEMTIWGGVWLQPKQHQTHFFVLN